MDMMQENALAQITFGYWRGEINPPYDCSELREALPQIKEMVASAQVEVLPSSRNRVVALKLPFSQGKMLEVVVKEFGTRGLAKIRDRWRGSKARRSFYQALALISNEIKTPEPIAYLEATSFWSKEKDYFLAIKINQAEEIRFLFQNLPPEQLDCLLLELAPFIRQMHDRGFLHRDLSDGNILVRKINPNLWEFFLLDPNRVKIKRNVPTYSRIKNLIRLGIPASKRKFFLEAYFDGQLPLGGWFWYLGAKGCFNLWLKIKKWLRLRALARRLRIQ